MIAHGRARRGRSGGSHGAHACGGSRPDGAPHDARALQGAFSSRPNSKLLLQTKMEVPGRGCCMCIYDCGCTVVRHGGYLMLLLRFAKRGGADVFITFRVFPADLCICHGACVPVCLCVCVSMCLCFCASVHLGTCVSMGGYFRVPVPVRACMVSVPVKCACAWNMGVDVCACLRVCACKCVSKFVYVLV